MRTHWQSAVALLWALASSAAAAQTTEPVLTPAALRADLAFMQAEIARIHPEPGLFASRETLRLAFERVGAELDQPLGRTQAWRVFGTLNPVFADAHMFVVDPDWKARTRSHLAAGGRLFPFAVQVSAEGEIAIRAELDGSPSPLAGLRIEEINGVPASQVARELLGLMAGETAALRAHLLSRRMWFEYWQVYGAPRRFELVLARPGGRARLAVEGSERTPSMLETAGPDAFGKTFQFTLLPGEAALLTINQFVWPDQAAFQAFTRNAFAAIRDAQVETLIIDVRENTGGDDAMWKAGVLPYIADKPFRNGSSYLKKVIAGRAGAGEKVGDTVAGFGDTWVQPEPDEPLRFRGKTYVLVGRLTYSSAVLFSNVVQDFGFARLAGAGGYARTRQTGGVQNVVLPNTGLQISIPRFVLDRPSGEREPALVHPDIVLQDSPYDRMQAVQALLARIKAEAAAVQPKRKLDTVRAPKKFSS